MTAKEFDALIDLISVMAQHRVRPMSQTMRDIEQKMINDLRATLVKE